MRLRIEMMWWRVACGVWWRVVACGSVLLQKKKSMNRTARSNTRKNMQDQTRIVTGVREFWCLPIPQDTKMSAPDVYHFRHECGYTLYTDRFSFAHANSSHRAFVCHEAYVPHGISDQIGGLRSN